MTRRHIESLKGGIPIIQSQFANIYDWEIWPVKNCRQFGNPLYRYKEPSVGLNISWIEWPARVWDTVHSVALLRRPRH